MVSKKKYLYLLSLLLILSFSGCLKLPTGDDKLVQAIKPAENTPTTNVVFQLKLPEAEKNKVISNIKAQSNLAPIVTFKASVFHTGLPTQPPDVFIKRVEVVDHSATVTFTGIPTRSILGEVSISGGNIDGKTEFHGAADLAQDSLNFVYLVPKDDNSFSDKIAHVFAKLAEQPIYLATASPDLYAATQRVLLQSLDPSSTTVDELFASFISQTFYELYTERTPGIAPYSTYDLNGITMKITNVVGSIIFPEGVQVYFSSLRHFGMSIAEDEISTGGKCVSQVEHEDGTPILTIVASRGDQGELEYTTPVLMKLWMEGDSEQDYYVNARSTAEALVLYDPEINFLRGADFITVRRLLTGMSSFNQLVTDMETAIKARPLDPMTDALIAEAATVRQALIDSSSLLRLSKREPLRFNLGESDEMKFIYIEDDPERATPDVYFTNRSFCHYWASVSGAGTESTFVSRAGILPGWSWPLSNKSQAKFNLGVGDFTTTFVMDKNLSILDGILTLASTILGVKNDMKDDVVALKDILEKNSADLIPIVNAFASASPSPTTYEGAKTFVAKLLEGELRGAIIKVGMVIFQEYFKSKFQKALSGGFLACVGKLAVRKLALIVTTAAAIVEISAIIFSYYNSPELVYEQGQQDSTGFYGDLLEKRLKTATKMSLTFTYQADFEYFRNDYDDAGMYLGTSIIRVNGLINTTTYSVNGTPVVTDYPTELLIRIDNFRILFDKEKKMATSIKIEDTNFEFAISNISLGFVTPDWQPIPIITIAGGASGSNLATSLQTFTYKDIPSNSYDPSRLVLIRDYESATMLGSPDYSYLGTQVEIVIDQ